MFTLDPRLQADTVFICDWPISRVLLMNDARFPWVVLAPRRHDIAEFYELTGEDRLLLTGEIARASAIVKFWAEANGGCHKINVGMIGNVVRQLHVHIVARTTDDLAWPHPVWGRGEPIRYSAVELQRRGAELMRAAAAYAQ